MKNSAVAYARLRAEIPVAVRLIAVSKKQDSAAIKQVYEAGCRDFGENYLQEALPKIKGLQDCDLRWHFIGRIQTNKIKDIAQYFQIVHTVDRLEVAVKLNQACQNLHKRMPIFLQVNLDREPQKAGLLPEELPEILSAISGLACLDLQGLMLIPALESLQPFERLRALRDQLEQQTGLALPRLSMGMSRDYPAAIAERATDVRLGEVIFGARH